FFYLLASMQPEFIPPEELLNSYEAATKFYKKFSDKIDKKLAREGLANLLFHLALQYFYLGDLSKGCQTLYTKKRLLDSDLITEAREIFTTPCPIPQAQIIRIVNSSLSNLQMCQEFFKLPEIPEEMRAERDQILEKWDKYSGYSSESIYCLLVEKKQALLLPEKARLIELTAHGHKNVSNEGQNIFKFFNLMSSLNDVLSAVVADSLEATDYIIRHALHLKLPAFYLTLSFPDKNFLYTGQSLGLPVALLSLSQKVAAFEAPVQLSISREAGFTGRVDINGQVLRIEPEGLEEKIKTAFYSGLHYLVIPEDNIKEASLILYQLLSKHPFRRLELVGVKNLTEIIENKKLVKTKSFPHLIWVLKSRRHSILKSLLFLLALSVLLIPLFLLSRHNLLLFRKNNHVVSLETVGDRLLALNENKIIVWKHQLKNSVAPGSLTQELVDFEGDQKKEILVSVNYKNNSEVLLFEQNGHLRWSYQPGKRIRTLADEFSNNFITRIVGAWNFRKDSPEKFILVVANHVTWYPVQISLLNSTGQVIGEYWQVGHLGKDTLVVDDIDEDGWNEIIIAGTNNDFQSACLLVLDPRKVEGCSPSSGNPEFQFSDFSPGTQEYYIVLPRTTLNQVMALRNYVRQVVFFKEDKTFEVACTEFSKETNYEMLYNFDNHFQPLFSRPTDLTIEKIKEFMVSGILPPHALTELRILKEKIKFWDGEGWSYQPARNKNLTF
ncbi:MAG: hypothetical protein H5U07_09385, partial [Candidatus Aminicenantes bacterium]|nr:hypothetical protein [Candidatus Aminicenantes bacterium]